MSIFNIVEQASYYRSYHGNWVNRIIHFISVPIIIYGLWILLGAKTQAILVVLALYYAALDLLTAVFLVPILYVLYYFATETVATMGEDYSFTLAIWLQIMCWTVQVGIGHFLFEGRKPALLDSLFQVIISPAFLTLEFMIDVLGMRKEMGKEIALRASNELKREAAFREGKLVYGL